MISRDMLAKNRPFLGYRAHWLRLASSAASGLQCDQAKRIFIFLILFVPLVFFLMYVCIVCTNTN